MAAAAPRFCFGDFTQEEQDSYLPEQTSCVELPSSWTRDGKTKLAFEEVFNNKPSQATLKDENENHLSHEKSELFKPNIVAEHALEVNNDGVNLQNSITENPCINDESVVSSEHLQKTETTDDIKTFSNGKMLTNGHSETSKNEEFPAANETSHEKSQNCSNISENSEKCSSETSSKNVELIKENKSISSWASLFNNTNNIDNAQVPKFNAKPKNASSGSSNKTNLPKDSEQKKGNSNIQNGYMPKPDAPTKVVSIQEDPFSKQLADQIIRNEIVYRSPGLMPRGFLNSSNWCYVNATLQALLTSSPFCHLMRSFPSRNLTASVIHTSTPILDSFVRLVKELKPMVKKMDNRNYQRASKEQWHGPSYEPEYIYKMLATIKTKFSERGRQEDAEEFLSCVLNGLHEEMLKITEYYSEKTEHQDALTAKNASLEIGYEIPVHDEELDNSNNDQDEDEWEEVKGTRKNRNSVMRHADISRTPLSDIFRGELRSDFFPEDQRSTATLEPFYTLPLDITDHKTWSVNEALEHLTQLESVQDFTDSKTKTKVKATRRLTFQTLPPVLILHLKRFVYDKTGGSLKIDKEVQYHTDLTIGKELLAKSARKTCGDKRSYKLFAVVYHHGKKSNGGHYSTDVYHGGLGCWLRIDDQHIKQTNVHEVVRHNPIRTAYLLYYKRTDLMAV